jgi:hypothetical protein
MKIRFLNMWERLRANFWFVPSLLASGAALLALVMLKIDAAIQQTAIPEASWAYVGSPEGARALLSTVAGWVITVAGVTFSITSAALTLASSQFGPRLLLDDPIDETVYLDLMRLLALNDDRAGALRVYHTCADILQRELGVEPGQSTREAYERLLHLDTEVARAAERQPVPDARLPLIGRQYEWKDLQAAWRHASAGQPGFALITGEAGIGKSHLAENCCTGPASRAPALR